jgi:hypothetical protein
MLKEKQASEVGVYVKVLKCVLCKRKLSDSIKTESVDDGDQVIVLSLCGHCMHNSCYQETQRKKEESEKFSDHYDGSDDDNSADSDDRQNLNAIRCKECGICIHEIDSIYLNKTNRNLIEAGNENDGHMQLKAPGRAGIYKN